MALWSCFEGIPGLYQKAFEEGVFTADSYNAEKLKDFTKRRLRLQPEEETYVFGISRHGRAYNQSIDRNNPILNKLLNNGIIGYRKSQNLYIIDPVVFAAIECRDDARTPTQIIEFLKEFGFARIVHHMSKDILSLQNIKQPLFPIMESGNFFINDDNSYCACFSGKLDNQTHQVKFCSNIENKLHNLKPSEIGILLCSPTNVDSEPVSTFANFNFSWAPKVTVYKSNVAGLVTKKAQDLNNNFFTLDVVM